MLGKAAAINVISLRTVASTHLGHTVALLVGVDHRIRWRNPQAAPQWAVIGTNAQILLVETISTNQAKISL